ncbi:uncharacterized protein LOC105426549 [Pogonomyrmex barbatus]|uniref:Uncharacterized protein LOC105426549 n=1 Tax=Pogonomyrmex barbatus TaxID=144034 RepID=A0A6I9WB83_9HYME|nr:uncharacterized protein LOC105426549 [Pogonomyrmex barbatus]
MCERGINMDRIYIDEETGEDLIYPFYDYDICHSTDSTMINDAETGEPEVHLVNHTTVMGHLRKVPFQIPKEVKEKTLKKRYQMELEPVPAGASFGQINPVCLFLPAIIYFRWFLALLMIFEVILHVWAHHKNKTLKNTNVYFRSPFHDISAEFCALCQNETCMNRVGKMHQIRMHKFLRQCNYMKRVVT